MKKQLFAILIFPIVMCASQAYAQSVPIDTNDLTDKQKAELILKIEEMKNQNNTTVVENVADSLADPQKLNEWVELGKNVGLAMTAVARELGVAADQILNSTTGKIAMVMIVWKVMGQDILDIVGGVATWFVITPVLIWSFNFFHMTKPVKNAEGKVEYIKRYNFASNEARNFSAGAHLALFVALTIVCMVIVFGR